jgi:hypothetical protein
MQSVDSVGVSVRPAFGEQQVPIVSAGQTAVQICPANARRCHALSAYAKGGPGVS